LRSLRLASVRRVIAALAPLLFAGAAAAQDSSDEGVTSTYLESIRRDTPALVAFLREVPKGADLHSHLSGAVYAESFLRWAAEDEACVSRAELRIIPGPCASGSDTVAAGAALADAVLYSALVDALSMRNWNAARGNGHDQFFATFGRMYSTGRRSGDMLAEAARRAAAGNVSYLELMFTPDGGGARSLGERAGWLEDFARMRDTLLALGLERVVALARARIDSVEARRDTVLACGTATADPGCAVTVRWLYQVARATPPQQIFAQILTGFVLSRDDPRVVGLNLVQPEDALIAMRDYSLHMRMIGALRPLYPSVRVSLHAGELASGLVPPEGLRFHVRERSR
jgi:adenosine deaminase